MTWFADDWGNFFVAQVGAAATLSGLLFVAVSINLARILAIEHLPERAAETLTVFVGVLVVATFGLVPGQSATAFGVEIVGTGSAVWIVSVKAQMRAYRNAEARRWLVRRAVGTQAATLPFVVGGALLVGGRPSGLYWLVGGVLASFAAGIQNAWVLLVEILR
ncbi:MAG: hypothetical protein ABSF69_09580 [Polyangiaceae bacterium]